MNNFNLMKMEKNTIRTKIQIKKTTFILTVLSFIILNFFLAFFINVDTIKSRVEAGYFFTADFHKNVSSEDKEKLEIEILKLEGVKQVRYVSKEEAFQKVQYQLDVAIPKGENPLSDSLIIFFDKPTDIEKIQVKLENNAACVSARNTVQYVKNVHPREDGKTYSVSTDWKTHTVTIKVVDP